jgi:hypothetical protein
VAIQAAHEAAHAVAGLIKGWQIACLSVAADEHFGEPHCNFVFGPGRHICPRENIIVTLAGRHGAALAGARDPDEGCDDDLREARMILAEFRSELPGDSLESLNAESAYLVQRYRENIWQLALTLIRKKTLRGDEVYIAAGKPVPPSPFPRRRLHG